MRATAMRAAMALAMGLMALTGRAEAGVIIDIDQVGPDVVATGSGSIDLTGLTFGAPSPVVSVFLLPALGDATLGPAGGEPADEYTGLTTGPTSFGAGAGGLSLPGSGSGDVFGIFVTANAAVVPAGYVSGTPLSATDTWAGRTFATLGLTPGTYTWTWGTGAHADSLTIHIGAVPEPSTFALAGLAAAIGGACAWRRRRRGAGATA